MEEDYNDYNESDESGEYFNNEEKMDVEEINQLVDDKLSINKNDTLN